ncbi:MAG: FecR family protein [Bacteroidota bacterium]
MKTSQEKNSEIETLAEKLLNGTITSEEFEKLEQWYTASPQNHVEWKLAGENTSELRARMLHSIKEQIQQPIKTTRLWKSLTVAASILLTCSVGIWIWQKKNTDVEIVQHVRLSTEGKITKIYLPDHSIIWLKGQSRLEYPSQFTDSTRNVVLHGEALFEVAKDPKHPFIITTGKYVTRVLGTSFNINENAPEHTFKLTVLTGKVLISQATSDSKSVKSTIVMPGNEYEMARTTTAPRVVPVPQSQKVLLLEGTEYDMNFENASFEVVRSRIAKKFGVRIIADKNNYVDCSLTADVTDQSLENTMKVISSALNLKSYTINRNEIKLTGGGCK